jgi:hypothetical protein
VSGIVKLGSGVFFVTEEIETLSAAEHIMFHSSAITSSIRMFLIRQAAAPDDLDTVQMLLKNSGLPRDGINDTLETLLVATQEEQIVGSAALEIHGEYALLRSVAVSSDLRNPRAWCASWTATNLFTYSQTGGSCYENPRHPTWGGWCLEKIISDFIKKNICTNYT